jgi:hypothetical protein
VPFVLAATVGAREASTLALREAENLREGFGEIVPELPPEVIDCRVPPLRVVECIDIVADGRGRGGPCFMSSVTQPEGRGAGSDQLR